MAPRGRTKNKNRKGSRNRGRRIERKRATAKRETSQNVRRYDLALKSLSVGVWDWNLETNAVVYSSRWKSMLGYSDDEIEPHVSAWERLVHPDDRSRADRAHETVAVGERATYEAEFRLRPVVGLAAECLACRAHGPKIEPEARPDAGDALQHFRSRRH